MKKTVCIPKTVSVQSDAQKALENDRTITMSPHKVSPCVAGNQEY